MFYNGDWWRPYLDHRGCNLSRNRLCNVKGVLEGRHDVGIIDRKLSLEQVVAQAPGVPHENRLLLHVKEGVGQHLGITRRQ